MTVPADYEELRRKHHDAAVALIPDHVARTFWPRERILAEQEAGLRRLLAVAMEKSPWYQKRLAGIDPTTFTVSDLASLPVATKADFDANFSDILTDRNLNRDVVEKHLAGLTTFDAYLPGTTSHAAFTGGSSGLRGIFVYDWDAWIVWYLGLFRYIFRDQRAMAMRNAADGGPPIVAGIGTQTPAYGATAVRMTFAGPELRGLGIPILQPMPSMVQTLNESRPDILYTYPSILRALAYEKQQGRLLAEPAVLLSTAEPLLPDTEAAVHEAWPKSILLNWYATTEAGAIAVACGQGPGMHISEDYLIVECVDEQGRPVAPGVRSHRIFVTNLANTALPTIRYEISDQVTLSPETPCPCGSQHRRIEAIEGRVEDSFWYPGEVFVHFTAFYIALTADPGVLEFQVFQTPSGARVVCHGPGPDVEKLHAAIVGQCRQAGLADPEITVEIADGPLPRLATTGKLKRFHPLTAVPR